MDRGRALKEADGSAAERRRKVVRSNALLGGIFSPEYEGFIAARSYNNVFVRSRWTNTDLNWRVSKFPEPLVLLFEDNFVVLIDHGDDGSAAGRSTGDHNG